MTTSNSCSLLKDVIAYVDVWSKDRMANYSKPFVEQLQKMGAQVSKTFNKQVTHVVFNNGHPATWRKAKKSDVRLVSVLWVSRCSDDGVRVDEGLFPASDETNPALKNKRHRCMLPKDSPERTPDNNTRMRKKLDKMMKDLAPKQQYVTDVSPVIIDEENRIVYSPGLKRSDYMAKRLKDMKEKHENLSPTASQMVESCSPTGLKPSLGSTPTFPKFIYDQSDDDSSASAAEPAHSPDKEEGRTQGPEKPWLSPCHHLPKRFSHLNKSEKGKQKSVKSFTETKNDFLPDAVNSPSCLSSPAKLDDAAVRLSEDVCTPKRKQKTPKRGRLSSSAVVQSLARSGDTESFASCSTGEDDSVFEDFLSPANQRKSKRPPMPNLPVESDIQVPFELCSVPNKRKLRRSERITMETNSKKKKKEPVDCQKGQQCDAEPPGRLQQDVEKSVESQSVTHGAKRRRQSTLPFTSTSKASDGRKQGGASSSVRSAPLTEADTAWKLQKNSDVSVLSRASENDWADDDSAPAAKPAHSADMEERRTQGPEKPSPSSCRHLPKQISRLNKSERGKRKATKSFTDTKNDFLPDAVNSPSCLSSPAKLDDAAVRLSEDVCVQKRKQKTPKRGRSSSSTVVQSLARSGDTKRFASGSTGEDDSVFEDYFSPANQRKSKRPLLPSLPVESDIQVPFELCSVPNKRKLRRSESITSETNSKKKRKLEESQRAEISDQQCDAEPPGRLQQDVERSVESQSVTHGAKRRRQSTLPFTSTSKASDGGKQGGASSSVRSAPLTEADTAWKLQKNSDVSVLSRASESE